MCKNCCRTLADAAACPRLGASAAALAAHGGNDAYTPTVSSPCHPALLNPFLPSPAPVPMVAAGGGGAHEAPGAAAGTAAAPGWPAQLPAAALDTQALQCLLHQFMGGCPLLCMCVRVRMPSHYVGVILRRVHTVVPLGCPSHGCAE